MKECENRIVSLPLPNGKFPFTEAGIISAQEEGFREGWRAALEMVLKNCPLTHIGREKIQEELNESDKS